jgi:hypothetical protein
LADRPAIGQGVVALKKPLLAVCALLGSLALGACREIPADRLYALHLQGPPTTADWQRSLPRSVTVRGGHLHQTARVDNLDDDTVHTSTASCHHGAALPPPIEVELRAFYTEEHLYLRLSWPDATRDDAMMSWRWDGQKWRNSGAVEDGFGILWDQQGRFPRFTCSVACHIDNFAVSGANFHASNRMRLAAADALLDLWQWRAERTGRYGFADDRFIDQRGIQGDLPGDLFRENSQAVFDKSGLVAPFAEGDRPIYDGEGEAVDRRFRPPGNTAPGYMTERPVGSRADIVADSSYQQGRWVVVLRRALDTGDPRDARFVPGDMAGVPFGLAIMDHTVRDHYASASAERLVLLPRQ